MKLYFEIIKLIFNKYIRRMSTGESLKRFCEKMGIVYIKLAQILATQNFGEIFTEKDRRILSSICDNVNPVSFDIIKKCILSEYGKKVNEVFSYIDKSPVGSASISQVHKAILKSGEVVAVKVKRKDITEKVVRDIKRIKKLMHRFGKFVNFKNLLGGDKALELYLSWIYQECDFENEVKNIKTYENFASSVNGKIKNAVNIKVPKVYEELCTKNIIVMEFIESKTINKIELCNQNNEIIMKAINSYLQLSFYALFHNKTIVFHGDPHGGNIYIDEEGNIGFLDMGLIFELSKEDEDLTRDFFLSVYTGNYEKLYEMIVIYGNLSEIEKINFKNDVKEYSLKAKNKTVTSWFTDLIFVCLNYNICPPTFLFCMAKAFMCLDGINGFSKNFTKATTLLQEQTMEYFINRSFEDCKELVTDGIMLVPKLFVNTLKYGVVNGFTKEVSEVMKVRSKLKDALNHCDEIIDMVNINNS